MMMILTLFMWLLQGCPPPVEDPSPTAPYTTPPPAIVAAVEDHAWAGELYWQSYSGSPENNELRQWTFVELHVYEYDDGFWCGYTERFVTAEIAKGCTPAPCEWEPIELEPEDEFGFSHTYGTITLSGTGDEALLCGWIPAEEEDRNTVPSDPDTIPAGEPFECDHSERDADYVGYWDLTATTPSDVLFGFDADGFEAQGQDIDYPPTNLDEISLNNLTQSEWCGTWVGAP